MTNGIIKPARTLDDALFGLVRNRSALPTAFVHMPGATSLVRAPWDWTDHESRDRFVRRPGALPAIMMRALRFEHPARGVHWIYVEVSTIGPTSVPSQADLERLGPMLERALAAEGR